MSSQPRPWPVDAWSIVSLHLKTSVNARGLDFATGFLVSQGSRRFLITNGHVLTGRHRVTGLATHASGGLPDKMEIAHHKKAGPGEWKIVEEPLFTAAGDPRWIHHPSGPEVDVAALELSNVPDDISLYQPNLKLADVDLEVLPGDAVSVVGFPFGLTPNSYFGIWKTGHLASDLTFPYQGHQAFLIDATTRPGMSGSLVVVRRRINKPTMSNGMPMTPAQGQPLPPFVVRVEEEVVTRFLGIYSGRIDDRSEIGIVWKREVIREVLDAATRGR